MTATIWIRLRMVKRAVYVVGLLCFIAIVSVGLGACQPLGIGYVGADTCLSCHNGNQAMDKRGFLESNHAALSCEICHGPGALHVRNGGRYGLLIGGGDAAANKCKECHAQQYAQFAESEPAKNGVLACTGCHDPHDKDRPTNNNEMCLKCHSYMGFATEQDIAAHTHHNYDPQGTGQSRCVLCHFVPLQRADQQNGPHNHSLMPIPPIASNSGVVPAPPNSCAGTTGCHDGSVPTAPVFNVDDPAMNVQLQILYDSYKSSSKTRP